MTILIVDDDSDCRDSLGALLEFHGYSVIKAEGALEALDILRERGSEVSLMLIDYLMPEMNGYEFLSKARSEGYKRGAIIVTALLPMEDFGDASVIRKPYDAGMLLETIRGMLGREDL